MKRPLLLILLVAAFSLACLIVEQKATPVASETFPTPTPSPILPTVTPSEQEILQACLDRMEQILKARPFAPIGNDIYESNNVNFNLVIYEVEGDEIRNPRILSVPSEYRKYQEDTASHRRIWDFYVAIVPPAARAMVKEFVIFTDGQTGDYGAWVRPSRQDPALWQVGFDLLDSDQPLFLAETLLHETGHLLTLNVSQVPIDKENYYYFNGAHNDPECPQLAVDGGCSLPDSYINLFYQRFWKDIYFEWWKKDREASKEDTRGDYLDVMAQFYEAHRDLFLVPYAATNIKEDMSESFSFFALNPKPTSNSIPDQKVAFFYEFPELVELREYAIQGICSYVNE